MNWAKNPKKVKETREMADIIVTVSSVEELKNIYSSLLLKISTAMCKEYGFYTYINGDDKKVFVEVVK